MAGQFASLKRRSSVALSAGRHHDEHDLTASTRLRRAGDAASGAYSRFGGSI
jgi:hypothetical protein